MKPRSAGDLHVRFLPQLMLRLLFFFGILGPLFGSVVFLFAIFLSSGLSSGFSGQPPGEMLVGYTFVSIFWGFIGYVIALPVGGIPGAVSGFGYWYILKTRTRNNLAMSNRIMIGAALGLSTTTIFGIWLFSALGLAIEKNGTYQLLVPMCYLFSGMMASSICAALVGNRFYRFVFPDRCTNFQS